MKLDSWLGPRDGKHGMYVRLVHNTRTKFAHATYVVADGILDALARAQEDDKSYVDDAYRA